MRRANTTLDKRIAEEYKSGKSMAAIEKELCVSYDWISNALGRERVQVRQGRPGRKKDEV